VETVAIKLKVKLLVNLASETIFTHKTLLIFNHLSYGGRLQDSHGSLPPPPNTLWLYSGRMACVMAWIGRLISDFLYLFCVCFRSVYAQWQCNVLLLNSNPNNDSVSTTNSRDQRPLLKFVSWPAYDVTSQNYLVIG